MPNGNQRKVGKGQRPSAPSGNRANRAGSAGAAIAVAHKAAAVSNQALSELKQLRRDRKMLQMRQAPPDFGGAGAEFWRQVRYVVQALIDPYSTEPFRFTPNGGRPTAVNRLFAVETAGVPGATNSGTALAIGCGFAAVFRDPRLGYIKYEVNASPASTYNFLSQTNGGYLATFGNISNRTYWPIVSATLGAGWSRHGSMQTCIMDAENVVRVWLDVEPAGSSTTVLNWTNLGSTTSITVLISRLLNGIITESSQVLTVTSGSASYTVPVGTEGYYAFFLESTTSGIDLPAGSTFSYTTSCPHSWRHLPIPGFNTQATDLDAARVNSASIMFSDRTATLNTQGNITTYQSSGNEDWSVHAGIGQSGSNAINNYSVVSQYNNAKKGPYRKGRYNFIKLTGFADLEMINLGDLTPGSIQPRVLPPVELEKLRDYVVMLFDAGNISTLIGEWTIAWHVESETESQWRQTCPPTIHPDVFKEAQYIVGQASQDYENPKHLSAIYNFVKRAAGIASAAALAGARFAPGPAKIPLMAGGAIAGAINKAM